MLDREHQEEHSFQVVIKDSRDDYDESAENNSKTDDSRHSQEGMYVFFIDYLLLIKIIWLFVAGIIKITDDEYSILESSNI